jgi:hypothetical protein
VRSEYLGLGSTALLRLASVVSCFDRQVQAFQSTGGGRDGGPAECSRAESRQAEAGRHARTPQAR